MQRRVLKSLGQAMICLLALSIIVFGLARLTGNPVDLLLSETATEQDRIDLTEILGLDKPIYVQYWVYISNAVRGDLGKSIRAQRPVLEMIGGRLPNTLMLGIVSVGISILIALPIGVYAAVRRGSRFDLLARSQAVLGQAVPSFWLGLLLILVFAVWLHWLPTGGRAGPETFILPAVTLGWYHAAGIMRLTRSAMLDVLGNEYIKLARAKGASQMAVIWRHGFKNAAIPVVTFSILIFARALSGAIIVETVFTWPGVGRLLIEAVRSRDFPVVQAGVLLLGAAFVFGNLLCDILYGYLDPRIR